MIAATELGSPSKDEALEELKEYQRGDFEGIFRCEEGTQAGGQGAQQRRHIAANRSPDYRLCLPIIWFLPC